MNDITKRRLQLVANGYHPLPNKGKIPAIKGWNRVDFLSREMSRVETWSDRFDAPSTGVRIEEGLGVIDIDVDNPLVNRLIEEISLIAPKVGQCAPTRFGSSAHKMALFVRVEGELFVRIASKRYNGHCVEIFGGAPLKNGNCSRQFGVSGPHSFNDDGSVRSDYVWDENTPKLQEKTIGELPALSKAMALDICRAFEELAQEAGWKEETRPATDNSGVAYDIDENTRFNTNRGDVNIDYAELCAAYEAYGDGLRCSADFMPGRGLDKKIEHCSIGTANRHKCVAVYVHGDNTLHFPAELAPSVDSLNNKIEELRELPIFAAPPRPKDDASMVDKALWLGLNYGYCALSDTIVELFKAADDCQLTATAFQRLYRAWREGIANRTGRVTKYSYATGTWEVNPARLDIEAVRMRPDMPFPVYEEDGRRFKNTYLRPVHKGSGDIAPWLEYMKHLLPDATEREWFCNWLAHKHLHPGVPGVAVVMVAAGPEGPIFGAGRGILRDIVARLLGPRYVKPVDFDIFTGKSAQGIYTDWGAYSTLITVNEAKDTADSGRWTERRAVYERLREIVDPRAIERTFIRKGQQAFSGMSFASYLVFSNNRDALQIPDGDRRIAALANGERMTPEMAEGLQKWMEVAGNIAELARWLESRDLGQFDAYAPPVTETKTTMQELARSELDDAFEYVRRRVGPQRLFTGEQIKAAVLMEIGDVMSTDVVKAWVNKRVRAEASQVGDMRMTPTEGRNKILAWRGWVNKWVGGSEQARASVHKTAEILADRKSVVVAWPVT